MQKTTIGKHGNFLFYEHEIRFFDNVPMSSPADYSFVFEYLY
ncbi:MAG: hypothetical protein ACUZ8E_05455 [Candidatus Anammoxibacter sp.]